MNKKEEFQWPNYSCPHQFQGIKILSTPVTDWYGSKGRVHGKVPKPAPSVYSQSRWRVKEEIKGKIK